jgi:hypothetical protein
MGVLIGLKLDSILSNGRGALLPHDPCSDPAQTGAMSGCPFQYYLMVTHIFLIFLKGQHGNVEPPMRLLAAWSWTGRETERSWTGRAERSLSFPLSLSLMDGWTYLTWGGREKETGGLTPLVSHELWWLDIRQIAKVCIKLNTECLLFIEISEETAE